MFVVAIFLMVIGGFIALANWLTAFQSYRTRRFHSAVPLIGAVLLGSGMFILPPSRFYCWTALVFDYGTLALLLASPNLAREFWSTRRFNLIGEYVGQTEKKTICLRLFKNGVFTIHLQLSRPPKERGLVNADATGKWQREGNRITLSTKEESATFDVIHNAPRESLQQSIGFASWESNDEMSLAGVELVNQNSNEIFGEDVKRRK
jgi:hypothetical protein